MFKVAIGHSEDVDSKDAIEEILEQCQKELGAMTAQAGILYSSIDQEHEVLLNAVNQAHPNIELIGCSSDGEISSVLGFTEDSVTLILFHSDEVDIKSGVVDVISEDFEQKVADAIKTTTDRSEKESQLCIINPSGLTASGVVVLEEFKKNLGELFPVFGGSAADQWKFEKTFQFHKNKVLTDAVPFLIFSGPLIFGSGVKSGWSPIGDPGIITQVDKNVLFKIDDMTAIEFFEQYLGENISNPGEYPLAIFENEKSDEFYLRAALMLNQEDGSAVFAGDIPNNKKVQITLANTNQILAASKESINQSIETYKGEKPEVALCFSCSGRRQVLGTRVSEEYQLLKGLNSEFKIFGFYGFGEIAPLSINNPSKFHNETFVSLILGTT
jgi:hypothetical protein